MSLLRRIGRAIVLPARITAFERQYLVRMNRIGYGFFLLHVPAVLLIAWANGQSVPQAAALMAGALALPTLAKLGFHSPRAVSVAFGVTSMLLGGVLVHVGQGPMQIEMHFHFFVLIALLAVYANPVVILAAAGTVAGHHLVVWLLSPRSVFNYEAQWWVVAVHAAFVVLEAVAACFIARSFYDNVIGLEKIVEERTAELARRNGQMRRVLDNVDQGFLEIDRCGRIAPEASAVVDRWFGAFEPGATLPELLRRADPVVADSLQLGLDQVFEGFLPAEVSIGQLPAELRWKDRIFGLAFAPLAGATQQLAGLLVVITDVTAQRDSDRLEAEQRETARIFQCINRDKAGFLEFWEEADGYVRAISGGAPEDLAVLQRRLHTLKGNAAVFGLASLAQQVHGLEQRLAEEGELAAGDRQALGAGWQRVRATIDSFLAQREDGRIEIDDAEYESALQALIRREPHEQVARRMRAWRLEPVQRRFQSLVERVQSLGQRMGRGAIEVSVDDGGVRFDPKRWARVWTSFVHLLRNAVDHGIESPDERGDSGKPACGRIALRAANDAGDVVVSIADDGRGVDWRKLADRARERGMPFGTEEERQAVLFAGGISTRDVVTDVSGRGVGMSAVRSAAQALGGAVTVTSEPGRGTVVTLRIPRDDPGSRAG